MFIHTPTLHIRADHRVLFTYTREYFIINQKYVDTHIGFSNRSVYTRIYNVFLMYTDATHPFGNRYKAFHL